MLSCGGHAFLMCYRECVCVYDVAIRCPPAQLPLQRVQALAAQAGAGSKDLLLGKVAIVTGSSECCACCVVLCCVVLSPCTLAIAYNVIV
jgi:hypothetical protein